VVKETASTTADIAVRAAKEVFGALVDIGKEAAIDAAAKRLAVVGKARKALSAGRRVLKTGRRLRALAPGG
jgi:hypothetical protein